MTSEAIHDVTQKGKARRRLVPNYQAMHWTEPTEKDTSAFITLDDLERQRAQDAKIRRRRYNNFVNKTTHSWISTNTTTTVILPSAQVQVVEAEYGLGEDGRNGPERYIAEPISRAMIPAQQQQQQQFPHHRSKMEVLDSDVSLTQKICNISVGDGQEKAATPLHLQQQQQTYDGARRTTQIEDSPSPKEALHHSQPLLPTATRTSATAVPKYSTGAGNGLNTVGPRDYASMGVCDGNRESRQTGMVDMLYADEL